jgi:type II secretory pathway pseudopilin PulG
MPPTPPERKRWRWLRREAIDLGDVVVQIIAVVIGILLALLINNWVTQRQQRQSADEAMRAIRAELTANRAALHQSAKQLAAMAMTMQASPRNRNRPASWCYQWDGWAGTNTANLVESAYQVAVATQALSFMPFKQAQLVAQVYGHQHVEENDFNMIRDRVLIAGPLPLDVCLDGILGIVQDERALSDRYDPLIGPDQTAWPKPPSLLPSQSDASK